MLCEGSERCTEEFIAPILRLHDDNLPGIPNVGMTNNLEPVYEHKNGLTESFTSKYRVKDLAYYKSY